MRIIQLNPGDEEICRSILLALPEWFGRPEATAQYVEHASTAPMLVAQDKQALGFVALARHNNWTYEIHSMGVMPEFHRRGIGRALVGAARA